MNSFDRIGDSTCPSGIYLIDTRQRDLIMGGGVFSDSFPLAFLDGGATGSREGFFTGIARELHFPDYFGRNWDAVYDCLTDPSVMPADGAVLVLDGFDEMATREPEQWSIALTVLREACAFWQPLSRDLMVVLVGAPEFAPDVPQLPAPCLDA